MFGHIVGCHTWVVVSYHLGPCTFPDYLFTPYLTRIGHSLTIKPQTHYLVRLVHADLEPQSFFAF